MELALTPEVLGTIIYGVISTAVAGFIGWEHYRLRREAQKQREEQSLADEFISFAVSGFSVNRVTYQTPMAMPGRGYSFSAKAEAEIVIPDVLGSGQGVKWGYWRTQWRELPKISEQL